VGRGVSDGCVFEKNGAGYFYITTFMALKMPFSWLCGGEM
jgi:hypothetical protein